MITSYAYNANDQLISEVMTGIETKYEWDTNGNLIKKARNVHTLFTFWNGHKLALFNNQLDDESKFMSVTSSFHD